jgi:hypothetical protein
MTRQYLGMVPVRYLRWDWDPLHPYLGDWEWQEALHSRVLQHERALSFPPALPYQVTFVKAFIAFTEARGFDVCDRLYEYLSTLIVSSSGLGYGDSCFKTYFLDLTNSTSVTLREQASLITEGTTGLTTWYVAMNSVQRSHP